MTVQSYPVISVLSVQRVWSAPSVNGTAHWHSRCSKSARLACRPAGPSFCPILVLSPSGAGIAWCNAFLAALNSAGGHFYARTSRPDALAALVQTCPEVLFRDAGSEKQ